MFDYPVQRIVGSLAKSLIHGTLILILAGLVNRILAFYSQIVLMRQIGPESIGLLQIVYPLYILALIISSAGIPLALSKLIAQEAAFHRWERIQKLFFTSLCLVFFLSLLVSILCFGLINLGMDRFVTDNRSLLAFYALLPSILVVAVSSVFRGLFQGLQIMHPPALASIAEQLFRVVCGVSFAIVLLPHGVEWAAWGMAAGITIGEIIGLAALMIFGKLQKSYSLKFLFTIKTRKSVISWLQTIKMLTPLAFPITVTRIIAAGLMFIDSWLITYLLQLSYQDISAATQALGFITGAAAPLVGVPNVVTFPLAMALVPAISNSLASQQMNSVSHRTKEALRLTFLTGLPWAILLYYFGGELCLILFRQESQSFVFQWFAFGAIFLYLQHTLSGLLQGTGKMVSPLFSLVTSSILRYLLLWSFFIFWKLNVAGIAAAYAFSYLAAALMNYYFLQRTVGRTPSILQIIRRPALACIVMVIVVETMYPIVFPYIRDLHSFPASILVALKLSIASMVYFAILLFIKEITCQDLKKVFGFLK